MQPSILTRRPKTDHLCTYLYHIQPSGEPLACLPNALTRSKRGGEGDNGRELWVDGKGEVGSQREWPQINLIKTSPFSLVIQTEPSSGRMGRRERGDGRRQGRSQYEGKGGRRGRMDNEKQKSGSSWKEIERRSRTNWKKKYE